MVAVGLSRVRENLKNCEILHSAFLLSDGQDPGEEANKQLRA